MATDVSEAGAARPAPVAPRQGRDRGRRPYRLRFMLIYATLATVVGAAIAGIVLLAGSGSSGSTGVSWSAWKPDSNGLETRAKEIAEHVGRAYRLPNGDQLLDVLAKRPSFSGATQTIPVHFVAIHGVKGKADEITEITPDNSQMFSLCGLGDSCAIASGQPTVARGRIVRREALELSLYTFKYVPGVDHVISLIPPRKGQSPTYAIYFNKSDLQQQLSQPLRTTIEGPPPASDAIPAGQAATIDRLTEPHMYKFSIQPSQQGDLILVLAPAL